MHYYQFNIKDYKAHTDHLSLMEDLAFRRMLDWVYLHEKPLPLNPSDIAKRILMPTHSESIEFVLSEFFELVEDGYVNRTATDNINSFKAKSEKAKQSAKVRWDKKPDADDMRTHSEGNANHKPLTNNQVKDVVGKIQPEVIQSAFEHTWKIWSQIKKTMGVNDNSSKKDAKEKGWAKLFNPTYCKTNDEDYFRAEVNAIIKEIKKTHQPSEFNSYANMHFKKFLNQESWRKENV